MTAVKVLAGSVNKQWEWAFKNGRIEAYGPKPGLFGQEVKKAYSLRSAKELSVADQASSVRVGGALGWGTVGAVVAGPVGALVGGMLGGRGETITFVAEFDDGATMMGQVAKKAWVQMLASRM